MPHAVIRGAIDLQRYAREYEPLLERRGDDVLRADGLFLAADGRTVLLDAVVVEAGRKSTFYVKVSGSDRGSVTVRVDPLTRVERTEGVKALVGLVAADLLRRTAGAEVEATNLVLP
jgi:hypothetical protein